MTREQRRVVAADAFLEIFDAVRVKSPVRSKDTQDPSGRQVEKIGNVTAPVRSARVAGPRGAGAVCPMKSTVTSPDLNSSATITTTRFSRRDFKIPERHPLRGFAEMVRIPRSAR